LTVIYIEGFGRSGTTLLDAALGQVDGFFSLGEVALLWDQALAPGALCGCGTPAERCPVWGEVLAAARDDGSPASASEIARWRDRAFSLRESPLAVSGTLDRRIAARSERYLDALSLCYRNLADVTGFSVLIDSSKSPAYGYLVNLLPGVAVHTVHAVRDPRAVAFSWQRDRANEGLPAREARQTARSWALEETLADILGLRRPGTRTLVRYEDLIADPAGVIRTILDDIGERGHDLDFVRPGRIQLGANHIVCGNPSRFRRGVVDLRPDAEWETKMSRRQVASVTSICLPWIARYHYPIHAARRSPPSSRRITAKI
jgi:hypothetical protein